MKTQKQSDITDLALYELDNVILQSLVDRVAAQGSAIDMLDLLQQWDSEEYTIQISDYVDLLPAELAGYICQSGTVNGKVIVRQNFPYLLSKVVDSQLALEAKQLKQ